MKFTLLPLKGNLFGRKRLPRSSKILLVMKLTTLLLVLAFMQVHATGFAQKVTLSRNNISLEKVFHEIHKQTGYKFLWTEEQLANSKNVDVRLDNVRLLDALKTVFKGQPLEYRISNKTIVVNRKERVTNVRKKSGGLENIHIKGIVKDSATGNPLIGVSIKVKGQTTGTVTDINGAFKLTVSKEAVLEISYLGYTSKEVSLNGEKNIKILLSKGSATGLDEVVVIGYGTQKKSELIGAVSQIDADAVNNRPVTQLSQSITGQMPGVTAIQRSGKPGSSGSNISIRGVGSFGAATNPLIIVDGLPVSSMDDIDPNNVKSIYLY